MEKLFLMMLVYRRICLREPILMAILPRQDRVLSTSRRRKKALAAGKCWRSIWPVRVTLVVLLLFMARQVNSVNSIQRLLMSAPTVTWLNAIAKAVARIAAKDFSIRFQLRQARMTSLILISR